MFGGDASTVVNAGHYLKTVRTLYEEASYLKDAEMDKQEGYMLSAYLRNQGFIYLVGVLTQ